MLRSMWLSVTCARVKAQHQKPYGSLESLPVPMGKWEALQEKDPFTTRKQRHSEIDVTQKRVTLNKCHLFKKFKDLGRALLRALKLVSNVKK